MFCDRVSKFKKLKIKIKIFKKKRAILVILFHEVYFCDKNLKMTIWEKCSCKYLRIIKKYIRNTNRIVFENSKSILLVLFLFYLKKFQNLIYIYIYIYMDVFTFLITKT